MSQAGSSTGPVRTISKGKRHRIASYFRSKGIRWDGSHVIPFEITENCPFRSKSEEIDEEDLRYYTTERCIEAGEEYDPKLKWLESESESDGEVNDDQSSGCGSGVEECSSGEYTSSAVIRLEFVHPPGRGYVPDVGGSGEDVGDELVGPGVPGGRSEEHLEGSQVGRDRHF